MTALRTQLRSARQAYRGAHYPGDLAAELLPRRSRTRTLPLRHRWLLFSGCGATAAAAVLLSILITRTSGPSPWPQQTSDRGALVDWLPISPHKLPMPEFDVPVRVPELRIDLTDGVQQYRDLAMKYQKLQPMYDELDVDLPPVPDVSDLPRRGANWFRKVWAPSDSA